MIGERLRELRQAQGRSLADVAGKASISVATLSRIENDKQSIELNLLVKVAAILQVSPGDLLNSIAGNHQNEDPLAHRIALLETKKRAELWRDLAIERRTQRARSRLTPRDVAQQVEEVLAQVDFLREELETVRRRMRKRKNGD
ncbi:MAG TPA: helix-turn-helix domain-containing protein [Thermoanaerobaculia bacterium]|nr:helix-turn-helix domain-containing protein [Thermoanaerobaculia bacterium]